MLTKFHTTFGCVFSLPISVSVISRALIIYLIFKETIYYMDSKLLFKFQPDTDMDTKLKIHIDITVATPCSSNSVHNLLHENNAEYVANT